MKIVFQTDDVLPALQAVSQAIRKRNSFPILDNVVLTPQTTDDDSKILMITGSNLDIELEVPVPILDMDGETSICVNAQIFNQVLSKRTGLTITMETNESSQNIKCTYDGGEFSIAYTTAGEYPFMQKSEWRNKIDMTARELKGCIQRTLYAVSEDLLRPILSGICFDFTAEGLVCVGTDGHILVKRTDKLITDKADRLVIPLAAARNLSHLLNASTSGDNNPTIELYISESKLFVYCEAFTLKCVLADGSYPNYNSVIPKESTMHAVVNRDHVLCSLARLSYLTPMSKLVVLTFTHNQINITCKDYDMSTSGNEKIPCTYDGDTFSIGFKESILANMVRNIPTEDVKISFSDAKRAAVIEPYGLDDENVEIVSIIMPLVID